MESVATSYVADMIGRIDGPMRFRVYLQPIVAFVFAVRDARKDVRAGRAAYGWALLTDPGHRRYLLQDGWKGIGKVFLAAYVLDIAYQYVAFHGIRLLQAPLAAVLLALLPYVFMRGLINRFTPGKRGATMP